MEAGLTNREIRNNNLHKWFHYGPRSLLRCVRYSFIDFLITQACFKPRFSQYERILEANGNNVVYSDRHQSSKSPKIYSKLVIKYYEVNNGIISSCSLIFGFPVTRK